MTESDFRDAVALLDAAVEPEDAFGPAAGSQDATRRAVRAAYRRLARIVHPDANGHGDAAAHAFRRLTDLLDRADRLLAAGTYGTDRHPTVTVKTRLHSYVVADRPVKGDVCDLFPTRQDASGPDAFLKVARHPRDNDLVQNEASVLKRFARDVDERWHPFLPNLMEGSVSVRFRGGVSRSANVVERLDGFHTLAEVTARRGHVDPRDMAWMWRRLLAVLGAAHHARIVHASVTPAHVMIHPEKHGLALVDWCYAVEAGQRARAISGPYRGYHPPELLDRKPVGPAADMFMGAATMLTLVDRDVLPRPLRAHFAAAQLPANRRPDDAWELKAIFEEVIERVYGPRKFRPFTMTTR